MPNVLITPNMNLPSPVPGMDPGIDYAVNNQSCLTLIDRHNHSPGYGVQINPTGINIDADLPLNNNNLTLVRSVAFDVQSAPIALVTDLSCLYSVTQTGSNGDLWFNDASGNQIQMTKTGAVLATISALISGTNEASFVANQLVVNAVESNGTPANIVVGSVLLGNNSPAPNFLTLEPPNAMSASYNVTLPPPNASGATEILAYDTSNNITPVSIQTITPSGTIIMYGGAAAPSGYLICDGTSYLRSAQPLLFAAIGTAYGTADGTHFNVPDLRGLFPRGVTGASANDPDASGRTANNPGGATGNSVGSQQGDAVNTSITVTVGGSAGSGAGPNFLAGGAGNFDQTAVVSGTFSSTETRPKNVYVNFIIKT